MDKHECRKHGLTEFTEPNQNQDSFCIECCKEMPECTPPHLGMTVYSYSPPKDMVFYWAAVGEKVKDAEGVD